MLNLLTAMSLLLFLAVGLLWVQSYDGSYWWSWSARPNKVIVHSSRGAFVASAYGTANDAYHGTPGFGSGRADATDVSKRYVEQIPYAIPSHRNRFALLLES